MNRPSLIHRQIPQFFNQLHILRADLQIGIQALAVGSRDIDFDDTALFDSVLIDRRHKFRKFRVVLFEFIP